MRTGERRLRHSPPLGSPLSFSLTSLPPSPPASITARACHAIARVCSPFRPPFRFKLSSSSSSSSSFFASSFASAKTNRFCPRSLLFSAIILAQERERMRPRYRPSDRSGKQRDRCNEAKRSERRGGRGPLRDASFAVRRASCPSSFSFSRDFTIHRGAVSAAFVQRCTDYSKSRTYLIRAVALLVHSLSLSLSLFRFN